MLKSDNKMTSKQVIKLGMSFFFEVYEIGYELKCGCRCFDVYVMFFVQPNTRKEVKYVV